MAQPGETLVNPETGQKLTFRRTTAETGGELVEVESELPAGAPKPPAHYHPRQEEHFELLAGRVDVRLGKERRVLEAGDTLDIPAGVVHEMSSAGDEAARLLWQTRPVNRFSDEFACPAPGRCCARWSPRWRASRG
jgi:quercetin dioxygenase-like cupin family protein